MRGMRARRLLLAAVVLTIACADASREDSHAPVPASGESSPHRLPTGLHLDPAGRSVPVGNMPLGMIASRDGRFFIVSLSGWREQGIEVVDRASGKITQRFPQRGAFLGLAWSADGRTLYASGGGADVVYTYTWDA